MTSVSVLQEKIQKLGQLPLYAITNCSSEEGTPPFKCEVTANGKSSSACGKSKKEAKKNAAEGLLRLLQSETYEATCGNFSVIEEVTENCVGSLQTYCQRKKFRQPVYEAVQGMGTLPLIFEISCTFENHKTIGKSHCKKKAKQLAAKEMLSIIEWDELSKEQRDGRSRTAQAATLSSSFEGLNITKNQKKKSWDCIQNEELGVSFLRKEGFKSLALSDGSGMSALEVQDRLRRKEMSVYEALAIFKDSDEEFFDQVDNIGEFFDTLVNEFDLVYVLEFPHPRRKSECLCCIKIKQLKDATFIGSADSTDASFKKAVVNTLRSLFDLLKKNTGMIGGD